MSIMLLEVASTKTPLICSDIPENQVIFNNEETLFFESNNSDDLADKLNVAFSESKEMKDRADKAYEKLMSEFTWDKISKEYIKLFHSLIKK